MHRMIPVAMIAITTFATVAATHASKMASAAEPPSSSGTAAEAGAVVCDAQDAERKPLDGDMPITLDLKHLERCMRANMRVAAKEAGVESDPFKPIFHIMPAAGACGDPNGPIYAKGKYHMFFQHAPELIYGKPVEEWEEYEGSYSHTGWGHVSSEDLAYWEHEPIAIMPEKGSYDPNFCASGSAVIAGDGTAMIFYTAAEPQRQCIARSVDPNLRWWRKDPKNPIISEPPVPGFIRGGFRDPYLWREGDTWNLIVGGGIQESGGTALYFRSKNLTDWTYIKPFAVGMGEHCLAWECPSFLPFQNGKAVLFVSPLFDNLQDTNHAPRSSVVYTIASYQGNGEFQPNAWKSIDIGGPNNFYATQAQKTPDGRWLLWGMNLGGGSPGHDWTTHLSLPRVLTLRPDGLLGQEPPAELQKLRRAHWGETDKPLEGEHPLGVKSNTFEIVAEIEVGDAKAVGMDLRASDDFQTSSPIWLDVENATLHADGYSDDFKLLEDEQNVLRLHAFVDRSVLEVFVNRRRCATIRAFHDIEAKAIRLFSRGGAARIRSVDVWEMGSIWQPPAEAPVSAPSRGEATPAHPGGFQYFVGVVGNPSVPDIRWDDEELEQIKSLGVNMVQLSIAWGHKPLYQIEDFFPRLVYEQMMGWREMEGVVGVKEYYGFAPSTFSVNAAMLQAWMKSPDAPLDTLLAEIAAPYGHEAAPHILQAWEYVARSVETFPWDTTYMIGPMGLDRGRDGSHGWEPAAILNATWDTPIWKANRRANFMLTEESKAHPWLFEDAGLRLEHCASLSLKAVAAYDRAIAARGPRIDDIRVQREVVWKTARSVRSKSLHLLETLAAQDARTVQADEKQFALVVKRLESLLKKDVENQDGRAAVAQKLVEFQRDPKAWLDANLNPSLGEHPPQGYEAFSNATMDWDVWVPPKSEGGSF